MSKRTGGGTRGGSRGGWGRQQHAPAQPAPPIIIARAPPKRSMFRDAAAIAGGVTMGTAMGHVAGEAITSLFSGPNRQQVQDSLPQNYDYHQEPSGPCAYEISQFLQCAASRDLAECAAYNEALQECKRRNRIP